MEASAKDWGGRTLKTTVDRWAGSLGFRELNGRGQVKHAGVSIDVKGFRKMGGRLGVQGCEWP